MSTDPETEAEPKPKPMDGAAEPAPDAPAKPSKKRRRRAADPAGTGPAARRHLDADGRERPAFLLGFPTDPELESLVGLFESGNYRELRRAAPQLIERTSDAEVRAAAEELLRRIEPDPLAKWLLLAAIVLFICVVAAAYGSHV